MERISLTTEAPSRFARARQVASEMAPTVLLAIVLPCVLVGGLLFAPPFDVPLTKPAPEQVTLVVNACHEGLFEAFGEQWVTTSPVPESWSAASLDGTARRELGAAGRKSTGIQAKLDRWGHHAVFTGPNGSITASGGESVCANG